MFAVFERVSDNGCEFIRGGEGISNRFMVFMLTDHRFCLLVSGLDVVGSDRGSCLPPQVQCVQFDGIF